MGRQEQPRQILRNSLSLVGSVAMTSGLGFVYWFVAALLFAQAEIGLAAASISAMMLLASLATFGLGTLLIAQIPIHRGREQGLIATAMIVAGTVGVVLGILVAIGAAAVSREFQPLADSPVLVLVFSAGVGLTASLAVLDIALLGLLRGDLQFARAAVFSFAKLGLLVVVSVRLAGLQPRVAILGTWICGLLLSMAALAAYSLWKGRLGRTLPLEFESLRLLRADALRNHALNLSLAAPDWMMPILVTAILSASTSGAFFIAWMIAGVAMFVPAALAQTLYAVCARAPETLPTNLRLTLRLSFAAGVVIALGTFVLGPLALGLLGQRYIEAAPAMVILALGVFPIAIKAHYVTIGRLEDPMMATTRLTAAGALIELSLAAAGAVLAGLTGVAIGILLGLTVQAIAMTPRIMRALQSGIPGDASRPKAATT